MNNIYYFYGCPMDGLQALVVVPSPLSDQDSEALVKEYGEALSKQHGARVNVDLIVVKNNKVDWCFYGAEDEVNNNLIFTYEEYAQPYSLIVKKLLPRNFSEKARRGLTTILSLLYGTKYHQQVSYALSGDIYHLIRAFQDVDFEEEDNDIYRIKIYRKILFEVGQILGLLVNQEWYTSEKIGKEIIGIKDLMKSKITDDSDFMMNVYKNLLVERLLKHDWNEK